MFQFFLKGQIIFEKKFHESGIEIAFSWLHPKLEDLPLALIQNPINLFVNKQHQPTCQL